MSPERSRYLSSPLKRDRVIYSLRALGKRNVPEQFDLNGVTYFLSREHKHDFWAATAFYESAGAQSAVLKIGRTEEFAGLPLKLIGRWLRNREVRFYRRLSDVPNVPRLIGLVGETGFAHEFVPGRPLDRRLPTPDGFFAELQSLFGELHSRGIAYVDANKPQNILVGEDGKPHLIDFQISFDLAEIGSWFLPQWILKRLQSEDLYHLLKHKRRMRPDELTDAELARGGDRSIWIKAHRWVTKPYFLFRRKTFRRLRETGRLMAEGSK